MNSRLSLTVVREGNGLFISLLSAGDFSGADVDNRFYDVDELPPSDLAPHEFWGSLLRQIGALMGDGDA